MRGTLKARRFIKRVSVTPKSLGLISLVILLVVSIWTAYPVGAAVLYRDSAAGNNGAGSASVSIPKPATVAVSDVMIAIIATRGGTGVTVTPPSGWTPVITTDSTTAIRNAVYYRILVAGDPSTYNFTLSTTAKAVGIIAAYSGVDIYDPIDVSAGQANASSTTMTAPSISTQAPNAMLVAVYSSATLATFTAASGMTLRNQTASSGGGQAGTKVTAGIQELVQVSTGASGAKTMTSNTAAVSVGQLLALRPVVGIEQASYRFFENTDSTSVSAPLAGTNTPIAVVDAVPFRLRLNLGVPSGQPNATAVASRIFRLQYSTITDGACDTLFSGESYTDVNASSGFVRFYNNPTPASGSAYSANATYDPVRSGTTALGQKYYEGAPLDLAVGIPAGQDGLWDFALTTNGAVPGRTFCFRVQEGTVNSNIATYTQLPKITIAAPVVDQANYRFFANADSATPGLPLAAGQDVAATIPYATQFRLRQRFAVGGAQLTSSGQDYKLQYAEKSGTCDIGFGGETYIDVKNISPSVYAEPSPSSSYDDSSRGTVAWSAAGDATQVGDGWWATVTAPVVSGTFDSHWLRTSNHSFTIPVDAIIDGIEVYVVADNVSSGTAIIKDVRLARGAGGIEPTGKTPNTTLENFFTTYTYGSPTDLWGASWTPSDINSSSFGAAVGVQLTASGLGAAGDIDLISVRVHYSVPGAPGALSYAANPTPADLAIITSSGNDPINGARPTVYQSYRETDPFTNNVAAIPNGSDGLWDFALTSTAAANGKTYCIRTVKSDGTPLDSYSQIPEVTFSGGGGPVIPTTEQKLRGGQSLLDGVKSPFEL